MSSSTSMLRKADSKSLEAKKIGISYFFEHVTFACPTSSVKQQIRKTESDQRKRQTNQNNRKEKKAKYSEQFAQLHQSEEILADLEHRCKTIEEQVLASRNAASKALNEVGELICQYADLDNKLNSLEEEISRFENERLIFNEAVETEQIVKDIEQKVSKCEEFDAFISDLADRMNESSEEPDYIQLFYDALPTMERMLANLSV